MKFIALLPAAAGVAPANFAPYEEAESRRVWELYSEGKLQEIYLRTDRIGAVITLHCDTHQEALEAMESLPLVQAGLLQVELIALVAWPEMTRMLQEQHLEQPAWWPA
jgi:hypothetical protein